jgi:hypothetical protein
MCVAGKRAAFTSSSRNKIVNQDAAIVCGEVQVPFGTQLFLDISAPQKRAASPFRAVLNDDLTSVTSEALSATNWATRASTAPRAIHTRIRSDRRPEVNWDAARHRTVP